MNIKTETKTPDVIRQWYFDERVVVFSFKKNDKETIDVYADWVIETLRAWQPTKPLLIAYDGSAAMITPHLRKRAVEIYVAVPTEGIQGRTAIILPNSSIGQFMQVFANRMMRVQNPHMQRRFFVKMEEAVLWLNQFQPAPLEIPTEKTESPENTEL